MVLDVTSLWKQQRAGARHVLQHAQGSSEQGGFVLITKDNWSITRLGELQLRRHGKATEDRGWGWEEGSVSWSSSLSVKVGPRGPYLWFQTWEAEGGRRISGAHWPPFLLHWSFLQPNKKCHLNTQDRHCTFTPYTWTRAFTHSQTHNHKAWEHNPLRPLAY